jgi:nucleolar protein 12
VKGKRKETKKKPQAVPESSDEDEDSEVERRYTQKKAHSQPAEESKSADGSGDSDSDADEPRDLTHISLQSTKGNKKSHSAGKIKYTPPDETPAQRDSRTIFIGNLPLEVVQKKVRIILIIRV